MNEIMAELVVESHKYPSVGEITANIERMAQAIRKDWSERALPNDDLRYLSLHEAEAYLRQALEVLGVLEQ